MGLFSGWPWWGQLIGAIVLVLIIVFLFDRIIFPLLKTIT